MTEPIPIDQLTFGVELEVIMPAASNGERGRNTLAERIVTAGVECAHEAYNHRTRPHWKIVTDGSIGYANAEVVSPILRGQDGFEQIRKVCLALEAHGCRVDRTTGFHVHVGARDRFSEQIGFFKELVKTYAKYEPVIDQLVSRSRRANNSSWCRPPVYNDAVERATTVDRVMSQANPNGRYSKLNLHSYNVHGTVEFRQHQGTTNAQKIENWVKLCLRMVAHAARNTEMASSRGEFVPPAMPLLPVPPRFLTSAGGVAVASPPIITSRSNIGYQRHIDRLTLYAQAGSWGRVDGYDRRVTGTNTYARIVQDYRRRLLAQRDREDAVGIDPNEQARRSALVAEHAATVRRMRAEHEASVSAARAAWEASCAGAAVVSRPPTDATPATLEGLFGLVAAVESERAYFVERQMELN